MANGFTAWGGVFFLDGRWHAVGGAKGESPRLLGIGERTVCLAQADDWLNAHETDESAFKTRGWLSQPPTEKQLHYLPPGVPAGLRPHPLPRLGADHLRLQQARHPPAGRCRATPRPGRAA